MGLFRLCWEFEFNITSFGVLVHAFTVTRQPDCSLLGAHFHHSQTSHEHLSSVYLYLSEGGVLRQAYVSHIILEYIYMALRKNSVKYLLAFCFVLNLSDMY